MALIKAALPYFLAFAVGCYATSLYFNNKISQIEVNTLKEKTAQDSDVIHLIQENITQNEKLNREFEQKQNEIITINQNLERNIADAVKNDANSSGNYYNGIGTNSLQLYKSAFGYGNENKANRSHD